jgi:hypothetical protein
MNVSEMPNKKTDVNNNGAISTDFIGGSWGWPTGDAGQRAAIYQAHVDYTQGFFWFLANDAAVPATVQTEMRKYGLAADEFTDNGGWPWQLYVREGRRMVGEYVFTQVDRQYNRNDKNDSIGLFSYNIDTHNAQRFPQGDFVLNEGVWRATWQPTRCGGGSGVWCTAGGTDWPGAVRTLPLLPRAHAASSACCPAVWLHAAAGDVEVFGDLGPGQMPYRSVVPQRSEVTNLIVPVAMSASHAGYGAIRYVPTRQAAAPPPGWSPMPAMPRTRRVMDWTCPRACRARVHRDTYRLEPQFMILGQSSGVALAQALAHGVAVQDVDIGALQARLLQLGQLLTWSS